MSKKQRKTTVAIIPTITFVLVFTLVFMLIANDKLSRGQAA